MLLEEEGKEIEKREKIKIVKNKTKVDICRVKLWHSVFFFFLLHCSL